MAINEFRSASLALNTDEFRMISGEATTTDASPTVLSILDIPSGHSALVEARVTALRQSGSGTDLDSAYYIIRARAVNVSGALSLYHILREESEDLQNWDANLSTSGGSLQLVITGAATTSIFFRGVLLYKLSVNP